MSVGLASSPGVPVPARGGQAGDAFASFFEQQWSDVAGYCSSLVGDRSIGEDLAQEAFTRIYPRFPLLREPRPYCFRVATNLARSHARRHRREHVTADLVAVGRASGVDPHLLDAIHRLPRRLTEVVLLHYFVDLSVDDIAHTLHRPRGTVGRQLGEARSALAIAFGGSDD